MAFYADDNKSSNSASFTSQVLVSDSIASNNLVGLNAKAVEDIKTELENYTKAINKIIENLNGNASKMFGDNIASKFKVFEDRIALACNYFTSSFDPFISKLDYVKENYEKNKKDSKDGISGRIPKGFDPYGPGGLFVDPVSPGPKISFPGSSTTIGGNGGSWVGGTVDKTTGTSVPTVKGLDKSDPEYWTSGPGKPMVDPIEPKTIIDIPEENDMDYIFGGRAWN